ncbi:hypothetical protein [Lactococcus petauri]|uniref:Uncharacterized protein n=1 Tax=Lactococcus petauri TaxID=1940789 RepID=A0A252CFR6_9LACT|nr:hypothetical protein [Lactococcus petauri]OUK05190.1 hypothetical protein BZZ03_00270 [Lactococcus petauri]
MKIIKGILSLGTLFILCLLLFTNINVSASAKVGEVREGQDPAITLKEVFKAYKDTDTIVKLSSGALVHGKVSIANISDPDKIIFSIDTDKDSRARTVADIKKGVSLETVKTPDVPSLRDRTTPPTQLMNLGEDSSSTLHWTAGGGIWRYAAYAYQPVPVTTAVKGLCFHAYHDTMLAGDSQDWNDTYNTGVGHGVFCYTNEQASYVSQWVTSNLGSNILSCWSWSPAAGSYYTVKNGEIPF